MEGHVLYQARLLTRVMSQWSTSDTARSGARAALNAADEDACWDRRGSDFDCDSR